MKKCLTLILLILLTGCLRPNFYHNGKYDYSFFGLEQNRELIADIENSLYKIRATAKRFIKDIDEAEEEDQEGVAFSLDGGYLIALKHVARMDPIVKASIEPFGTEIEIETKLVDEKIFLKPDWLNDCDPDFELECRVNGEDIAILWARGLPLTKLPVPVGNSDELAVGQSLVLSTNPALLGQSWQLGSVARLSVFESATEMTGDPANGFMIAGPVIPGDSGNPVFALRDGVMELVGITQGRYTDSEQMGWALKINYVLEEVAKLIEAKGRPS